MREPSLRTSRLAIAGGLGVAAMIGGLGFYLGRTTSTEATPTDPDRSVSAPAPVPAVSANVANGFLDRADVIELATATADATASGEPIPDRARDAVGRRFEIALPFGCSGPAEADSEQPLRWRYDEGEETLRLYAEVTSFEPGNWDLDQRANIGAIEGFWIARPWSSRGECPQAAGVTGAAAVVSSNAEQTLAIAQFLRSDVPREAVRAGRPFQSVQRIPAADLTPARGFRLVLTGRVGSVPDGRGGPEVAVRCIQPGGIERRPRCVVAVTLDEVRIENPSDGAVLASWPLGRD